jgi:hypothetical protein
VNLRTIVGCVAFIGAAALSACAYRNAAPLPIPARVLAARTPLGGTATLELIVTIGAPSPQPTCPILPKPQGAPHASAPTNPNFISPATQSLALQLTPKVGRTIRRTVNLTSAIGCGETLTCHVRFELPPATYAATFRIYGQADEGGPVLDVAFDVPIALASGQTRKLVLAPILKGVPHSFAYCPGNWLALRGSPTTGFVLYGPSTQTLSVTANDAAGYTIGAPGAPSSYTMAVARGTGWTVSTTAPSSRGFFSIAPPGKNGASATIRVSARYKDATCQQRGARCTATIGITNDIQRLFVLNQGDLSSKIPATVTAYDYPYAGKPVATASDATGSVTALAMDARRDLFVANCVATCGLRGSDSVTEYAPPYASKPRATIAKGIANPLALVVDAAGNLYVGGNGAVTEYAPPYTGAPKVTISGLGVVNALFLDANGSLYVANCARSCASGSGPDEVLVYSHLPSPPGRTITDQISDPSRLIVDPEGNLYVSNLSQSSLSGNFITVYGPTEILPSETLRTGGEPLALAFDPAFQLDSSLYVGTCATSCGFGRKPDKLLTFSYTTPFTIASSATSSLLRPQSLVIDAFENLLVANTYNDDVLVFPPYGRGRYQRISRGIGSPQQLLLTP